MHFLIFWQFLKSIYCPEYLLLHPLLLHPFAQHFIYINSLIWLHSPPILKISTNPNDTSRHLGTGKVQILVSIYEVLYFNLMM